MPLFRLRLVLKQAKLLPKRVLIYNIGGVGDEKHPRVHIPVSGDLGIHLLNDQVELVVYQSLGTCGA